MSQQQCHAWLHNYQWPCQLSPEEIVTKAQQDNLKRNNIKPCRGNNQTFMVYGIAVVKVLILVCKLPTAIKPKPNYDYSINACQFLD